ncbi:hypothetical protein [Candidatus Stoquefichus sp. SB1]|uniref:hypothetical protein n=1 Tax=Candidatus Stoquefichus sp. SB1 TaxID=1658109 RepID=UPI00067EB093|nr:hypothetical protein [Candidatus Stoquefichus sp. SB1]
MLEKLSIRIVTTFIVLWYIVQMSFVKVYVDFYTFMMLLFYAIMLSLLIESLYSLLRYKIKYSPYMVFTMILICAGIYYWLGWGMYLGMSVYVSLSIGFDLYREYSMTMLLEKAMNNHK